MIISANKFCKLDFLQFDLDFQDDVTLLSIDNTIDLPLANEYEKSKEIVLNLIKKYNIDIIAIGNVICTEVKNPFAE